MNTSNAKFRDVDEYISSCPISVQSALKKLRSTIKRAAPKANERISYGMPFYEYGGRGYSGRLIYFAAFKKHISVFIAPAYSQAIPRGLQKYHVSKATYHFPIDSAIPYTLIERTVRQLVKARDLQLQRPPSNNGKSTRVPDISKDILSYNRRQSSADKDICTVLLSEINKGLPEADSKVWHGHPVWFLEGNPIVGYSKQKAGIRLMFWSGASFDEQGLTVRGGKFKDASVFFNAASDVHTRDLQRWLVKSRDVQWDYKNIVKRKGILERLK